VAGTDYSANVSSPDQKTTLYVKPGHLHRPAPISITGGIPVSARNLTPAGSGYKVTYGDDVIAGSSTFTLIMDETPSNRAAVFAGSGRYWSFVSNDRSGKMFTGRIRGSTTLAVFEDTTQPEIRPLQPSPGSVTGDRTPELTAYIRDRGAGIDGSDAIDMSIDGIPVYGEYDYEKHKITYQVRGNLRAGAHKVTVAVKDQVGNRNSSSWSFSIR
jgi:hypothetical protein